MFWKAIEIGSGVLQPWQDQDFLQNLRKRRCAERWDNILNFWLLTCQEEFSRQMLKVREISSSREETVEGGWYTEEKMKTQLKYSTMLGEN